MKFVVGLIAIALIIAFVATDPQVYTDPMCTVTKSSEKCTLWSTEDQRICCNIVVNTCCRDSNWQESEDFDKCFEREQKKQCKMTDDQENPLCSSFKITEKCGWLYTNEPSCCETAVKTCCTDNNWQDSEFFNTCFDKEFNKCESRQ